MDDYQKEHVDAFRMIRSHLASINASTSSALEETLAEYLAFRKEVDAFLETRFKLLCTLACYRNRLSACCSREGIIVFFADVAVNCILPEKSRIDRLIEVLQRPNTGFKCIYLSQGGCLWKIKPIVCQMFLCDRAEREVLDNDVHAKQKWKSLQALKKSFTWPDRQVLFDDLEQYFIDAGMDSPLMYFHKSPGLLRIKRKAGLTR